jgi:PST family polysaccharide transporter
MVAVAVRTGTALALNKLLALFVGPGGYALVAQFQSFLAIAGGIVGFLSMGVAKMTAEHADDLERQRVVWRTALQFALASAVVVALVLILAGKQLGNWLLRGSDLGHLFYWLALTLPGLAALNLMLGVLNGKKEVVTFVAANVLGSLLSLALSAVLITVWGFSGALLSFVLAPIASLVLTGALVAGKPWFAWKALVGKFDRNVATKLADFGLMALTTAIVVPGSHILIRAHLASSLGVEAASYWHAISRISEIYLMIITSTLTLYYLPRIAEIRAAAEMRAELFTVLAWSMPVTVLLGASIIALRDLIIATLFSTEFLPMRDLFLWQMLGDMVKIASWCLAFIMIGRGMVREFVITEIVFSGLFYGLVVVLTNEMGLVGASIAHLLTYLAYLLCLVVLIGREFRHWTGRSPAVSLEAR